MSFTLNIFDQRRTGIKLPYCLPQKHYIDGAGHDYVDPFQFNENNPAPAFIETDPEYGQLIESLVAKRSAALKLLTLGQPCGAELEALHAVLSETRVVAEEKSPPDFIDPSLPNFEQDLLQDERDRHVIFEQSLNFERVKLLYNAGLHAAREANKLRFGDNPQCKEKFEKAAGIFNYLSNCSLPLEEVPNEVSPEFLRILALCCLCGAAENEMTCRQVSAPTQWEGLTHLCFNMSFFFGKACSLCKRAKQQMTKAAGVACLANVENFTAVKYEFYKGLAHDYYSLQPQTRRVGGRLRKALRSYEHALVQLGKTMQGLRTNVEKEIDHLIGSVRVKLSQVQEIRSVIADVSPADAVEPEAGAVDLIHAFDECELLRLPPYYKACSADSILRSSRYEGATQSPGQKPTVPEWVHQFEEPGDGGEAHVEDHAQEEEPPPLPETTAEVVQKALQLELVVAQQDLFHKPLETRLDAEGNPLVSYHELDMVAKVTCADLKRVERAEGFATIMLFDTWAKVEEEQTKQQQSKIASVSEIAKLLLRVVGLTERDRVCVVGYVNGKLKVFPLTACDALGIESVARQISSLSPVGNHRGSKGSSIIKGLVEAMKSLQKQNEKSLSSYEVVVFSDGVDSTADTHYYNWTKLHSLYDAHATAEKVLGRVVRVHTFALGSSSDTYLLKAVAKRLGGDHSVAEMTHDGLSAMRMWLLRKIADQQSKVASSCKISVRCSQDVTMKQIGTYDLVFDPTFVHPHARDPCEGEMSLQDFSQGHSCHVVITLAIPESRVQFDPTQLAEVFVTYTDAVSGSQETLVQDIVIGPTEQVITREGFSWLPQLYCARVAGTVQLSGIGGGTTTLSSGDLVDPVDCIETKAGRMTAQLSDGTHFTFLERTSALLNSIDSGDRASCFTLRKGAIFISTGMGAECDVRILEPMYTVTVESHSFVKVGIEPKSGLITVNCMYGHAFITTERNDERSVVEVLSLRQTQMSDALSPITPWTLEEASYAEWLSPGIAADSFLSTLLEIGIQVCRTVCSEWLAKGALWLRKGSWERVTESKANRRCREFLIRFWLRESKHFLTNNMSGLSPETEHIRKVVDRGVQLGFSTDKSLRSDRRALFDLYRSAVSLRDERSAGSCDKYDTQLQRDLQAECADAKDKAERDREEAEASRQRQLRNHEASRRERILRTLFPLSDLDGVGVVYATTMEQAILTLSEVVDPVLTELVSNVCARWAKVLRAVTKNKRNREVATCAPGADHDVAGGLTLNEEDFVKMWISLTGECDTPWFNLFMEQLHGIVEELCILNEGSRRSRAVFSLFRKWDSEGNGVIRYSDLLATFEAAHGHDATYHSDLDRLKCGLHAPPPAAVKAQSEGGPTKELVSFREKEKDSATVVSTENSEPTTVGVVHSTQPTNPEEALTLALGVPPPEHISADHKVTLRKLHYALAAFYGRYTERAYHQAVEKLAQIVGSKRRSHNTIIRCVKSIQRSQEMEHLQQWDLRHVFDGISGKVYTTSTQTHNTAPTLTPFHTSPHF